MGNLRRHSALGLFCCLFLPAVFAVTALGQTDRFFKPTEGFIQAKNLSEGFQAKVRSIQLDVKDAFEGAVVHSETEQRLYDLGNKWHVESRPGTIRRRLLFREGDIVTKGLLLETEKTLRGEEFLADAVLEVKILEDGSAIVKATTYDQWTTVPGVSLQRLGGEWIYWLGPVESNLFGTGQRLGFFIGHDQFRDTRWLDYNNNALTSAKLRLAAHAAWLSDGYSTLFALSRPLLSRNERYAFSASQSSDELTEWVYFDHNRLDELSDSLARALSGRSVAEAQFTRMATLDLNLSVTRSFGDRTKFNVSPTFDRKDRYLHGRLGISPTLDSALSLPGSTYDPGVRLDNLLGVNFSLYQYAYKTVHNFRNLKWGETLETGWRLSTKTALNQEWMGARNSDFHLSHQAVYTNAWFDALFLNSNASLSYYVSPQGDFDDGYLNAAWEGQWKPHPLVATWLAASWGQLFAYEKSQQLVLGEESGLNGYPNAFYAGQARLLLEAEQRFFPTFEFGTVVPALAVFVNAGNTFEAYGDFDPEELHYSAGFGLRLGASKSVQKVVNHINLSWPIGDDRLSGPVFSIRAKKNL